MYTRRYTFDGQPIYLLGERVSELHKQIKIQDYYDLRQQSLDSGRLFEDSEFPATDRSLFYSRPAGGRFKWLRPTQICENPRFFVQGYSRFDVMQGELGDCWFIAAVANLALDQKLFSRVVCNDNDFVKNYAGIFHFCFWRFGKWVDVVVDDRLPTVGGRLVYMHSNEKNEFWSALLEKAYAKLHGSYEALRGGTTSEALEDFTGGVSERFNLDKEPPNLYQILEKGFQRSSMMACSIDPDVNVFEAQTPEGLVKGHAYSITKVQMVDIITPNTKGKIPLLRLRNPWGNHVEWNGAWCDKSKEWRYIPEHAKQQIGLTFEHDGEFWMSFKDFVRYFDHLDICNLSPYSIAEEQVRLRNKRKWNINIYEGEWVPGLSAGGCLNYVDSFHRNPQYVMKLEDPDEHDDVDKCTVIVSLMQKHRRMKRKEGLDFLTIGFLVYRITERDLSQKPLNMSFFRCNKFVARSPEFINMRGISGRYELNPGHYLIVPSTFEPNKEGEFLIRVFSETSHILEENDETVRMGDIDSRITGDLPDIEAPTPERLTIERLFLDIAGRNREIGWLELKQVLDRSIRNELLKIGNTVTFTSCYQSNAEVGSPKPENGRPFANILEWIRRISCMKKGTTNIESPAQIEDTKPNNSSQTFATPSYNELETQGFSKDACRSMIAMLDSDRSGKLGIEEFKSLLYEIAKWKAVFKLYDKDKNNKLDTHELRDALGSAGYRLNNQVLTSLLYRYGSPDMTMTIDDFIMCAVKVKAMIERFKEKDHHNVNKVIFTLDEWIAKALYS